MKFNDRGTFIDSGTTLTYFPYNQYIKLTHELDRICLEHPQCVKTRGLMKRAYHLYDETLIENEETSMQNMERLVLKVFPSINFTFNGKQF